MRLPRLIQLKYIFSLSLASTSCSLLSRSLLIGMQTFNQNYLVQPFRQLVECNTKNQYQHGSQQERHQCHPFPIDDPSTFVVFFHCAHNWYETKLYQVGKRYTSENCALHFVRKAERNYYQARVQVKFTMIEHLAAASDQAVKFPMIVVP